jgi:hypothetical protein
MFRELFSMPPGWLVSRGRTAKITALIAVALLLEGLAALFILRSNENLTAALRVDFPDLGVLTSGSSSSRERIAWSSLAAVAFPAISLPVLALSSWTRRAARRIAVHSMKEAQSRDTRAPLLFLRSFADDQVTLPQKQTPNIFARVLTDGGAFHNVDELLTERYTYAGPVIAIGKPGDKLPPLGAAREYLADKDWHGVVAKLMEEARAIVMTSDHTPGVSWEIEHARECGFLGKSVILIPPEHHRDVDLAVKTLALLALDGSVRLEQLPAPPVAIIPGPDGGAVVACSNRVDSHTYDLVLRVGLQAILERRSAPAADATPNAAHEDRDAPALANRDPSAPALTPEPSSDPADSTPTRPIPNDSTPTTPIPTDSTPTAPIPTVRLPTVPAPRRANTSPCLRPHGARR